MKTRQFPSLEEAQAYLEGKGTLKYFGREGPDAKTYVYTLTIGIMIYHLLVHENGLVRVTDQRYKI